MSCGVRWWAGETRVAGNGKSACADCSLGQRQVDSSTGERKTQGEVKDKVENVPMGAVAARTVTLGWQLGRMGAGMHVVKTGVGAVCISCTKF